MDIKCQPSSYLHEYCWRLANGNRDGWSIFSAVIVAIKDCFHLFPNANDVWDQTIREENDTQNLSIDEQMNFGTYPNEDPEALGF